MASSIVSNIPGAEPSNERFVFWLNLIPKMAQNCPISGKTVLVSSIDECNRFLFVHGNNPVALIVNGNESVCQIQDQPNLETIAVIGRITGEWLQHRKIHAFYPDLDAFYQNRPTRNKITTETNRLDNSHTISDTIEAVMHYQEAARGLIFPGGPLEFPGEAELFPRDTNTLTKEVEILITQLKIIPVRSIEDQRTDMTTDEFLSDWAALTTSTDEQEACFLYAQILIEIFLNMTYETDKDIDDVEHEMVAEFRRYYTDNKKSLQDIDQFQETYSQYSPVWWYSADLFVYRVVNKALRTQNTATLYNLRYFIKHLHEALVELHQDWATGSAVRHLTVYRGSVWPDVEFEKKLYKNIGGLLSLSSFTSTSLKRTVPQILGDAGRQQGQCGVLFEMDIDLDNCKWPCANISNIGVFGDAEQEILFSMGTVFRIQSVDQESDGNWVVKLRLTNDEDTQLKQLGDQVRKEIGGTTHLLCLAKLLQRMGKYDEAKYFYSKLMHTKSCGPNIFPELLHGLGTVNARLGNNDAENQLTTCLQLKQSFNMKNFSETITELGHIFVARKMYDTSLIHYTNALEQELRLPRPSTLNLALIYKNIGFVQLVKQPADYSNAIANFLRAYEIEEKHLSQRKHYRLADTKNMLGFAYYASNQCDTALKCFHHALKIGQKSLPDDHPSLSTTLLNIAATLDRMGQYVEAVEYINQAIQIARKTLQSLHPLLRKLEQARHHIAEKL